MAENDEDRNREDLSEEPSQHKIEEMRKKGRVAQSRELSGLIALIAAGSAIYVMSTSMGDHLKAFMQSVFRADIASRIDLMSLDVLMPILGKSMKIVGMLVLPIIAASAIFGAFGSYLQVGNLFSVEPLKPDLNRINPVKGAQRYFTLKQLYDGLRLVVRATAVAIVAYLLMKSEILSSRRYMLGDPNGLLDGYAASGLMIFAALCGVLLVFAGFDFWIQRWEFSKNVRLTKKEQKEEHKEHEGDPLVKARIRTVQREMARRRMMEAVKTADVMVTNPTHVAVALKYDTAEMKAPKVVAKGTDFLAQKLKKIAAEHNVPLVENVPLARALYKSVKVGKFIPQALYQAVAEVLAYVYRLKNKTLEREPEGNRPS